MATLRLIGFWRDERGAQWPDVERFVDATWDAAERDDVAAYVSSGQVWRASPGFSRCRLCGEPNGVTTFTDGVYAWPEGLAHYVETHDVRLPPEFVDHARARLADLDDARLDDSWWRSHVDPAG